MKKKIPFKLKTYSKWLAIILGTASCLTIVTKAISAIDNRYAKQQNIAAMQKVIEEIDERLDSKILSDQITSKQERIWALEDRFEKTKEKALQVEIRKLTQEIEELQKELENRIIILEEAQ